MNSRFACLMEEERESDRMRGHYNENRKKFVDQDRPRPVKFQQQQPKMSSLLKETDFPELIKPIAKKVMTNPVSNLDYSKVSQVKETETMEMAPSLCPVLVPPGWCVITFDDIRNKTETEPDEEPEPEDDEDPNDVFCSLAMLHENRTKEYIETYGYDAWEHTFMFPNYDYNWVDKLDEAYETMMAEEEAKELEKAEKDEIFTEHYDNY